MSVIPMNARVAPDQRQLADFCRRWKIVELALFGSVLRDDFRPDSDVDVLVTFSPDAEWTLLDHASMQQELSEIFHRRVDLLSRRGVERSHNPLRRQAILSSAQPYYVAG
jgi:predicted nucleotidyltransferase